MVGDMTMQSARIRISCMISGVLLCVGLLPSACADENLLDPTRPPSELAASSMTAASVASGPLLQSILISPSRKSAIIGGQVVGLGGKYGEARVVSITESEVVLKTGAVTEILRLFPDVEKRSVRGGKK